MEIGDVFSAAMLLLLLLALLSSRPALDIVGGETLFTEALEFRFTSLTMAWAL